MFENKKLYDHQNGMNSDLNSTVGIVIPTFNEEKNVEYVLSQLKERFYNNFLVIDGASSDRTVQVSAQKGAKVIAQTGKGKGQAIRQALQNDYLHTDILVIMDADGSMSPEEIPRFVEAIRNGADVVKGSRFLLGGGTLDMTRVRKFGNTAMLYMTNLLHSTHYTDICYGFAALNKKAIETLSPYLTSDGFDIEAEIFIKAHQHGLKVVEIPSIEYNRKNGESNLHSFSDGRKIISKIWSLYFHHNNPLKPNKPNRP